MTNRIYIVIQIFPFFQPFTMMQAFESLVEAEAFADELRGQLPAEEKPEYDDYGLVAGSDFVTSAMILNPAVREVKDETK